MPVPGSKTWYCESVGCQLWMMTSSSSLNEILEILLSTRIARESNSHPISFMTSEHLPILEMVQTAVSTDHIEALEVNTPITIPSLSDGQTIPIIHTSLQSQFVLPKFNLNLNLEDCFPVNLARHIKTFCWLKLGLSYASDIGWLAWGQSLQPCVVLSPSVGGDESKMMS
ncbi:uncharacterized protein ARMOST_10374 [Armillaria ostoyae]|uniref:Uncharacterized protein n=1 Tax=Armillaria ostoyae TaxID=47428 RepID=A0A284RE46_ARMOS|nr:uncharacterized protein ARMOST_10374 [Armillaria ostoyae]